ncbi:hypothetical protein TELCIR_20137, partial [Teladorsagia circumcincta]
MTFPSVRYAALLQDEQNDSNAQPTEQEGSGFEFGVPEGTFDSVFTYASYNDLDHMGYEAPARIATILQGPWPTPCCIATSVKDGYDELGSFTATYGVEITDVEFSDVKVIK